MKSPFVFLAMFFLAFNTYGKDGNEYLTIETDEVYNFVENNKISIEIKFKLSDNHNIYISPANKNSFSYFTKFKILDDENNLKIIKIKKPKGKKSGDDYILEDEGSYFIEIINSKKIRSENFSFILEIDSQICNNKTKVCYPPFKITKNIALNIQKKKK